MKTLCSLSFEYYKIGIYLRFVSLLFEISGSSRLVFFNVVKIEDLSDSGIKPAIYTNHFAGNIGCAF